MKLWLDDKRDPTVFTGDYDWIWVKTAEEAIKYLSSGKVTCVSLDHDLGNEQEKLDGYSIGNGYSVAKWIEESAYFGNIPALEWKIHSQNSVGVASMQKALENANYYWLKRDLTS